MQYYIRTLKIKKNGENVPIKATGIEELRMIVPFMVTKNGETGC